MPWIARARLRHACTSFFILTLGAGFAVGARADVSMSAEVGEAGGLAWEACTAVFLSGRSPDAFMADSSLFWLGDGRDRLHPSLRVDRRKGVATILLGKIERSAFVTADRGCVLAPEGQEEAAIDRGRPPPPIKPRPWPVAATVEPGIERARLDAAVDLAFSNPRARTAALLVVHKGAIVAERYGAGADVDMLLPGWSMTKTLQAVLVGMLVQEGLVELRGPLPIEAWAEDDRRAIRWLDVMRMSSGLTCSDAQGYDEVRWRREGYPDHLAALVQADAFAWAVDRPQEHPPGSVGRYRNCDALVLGAALESILTRNGRDLRTWPRQALYEPLGMTSMVVSTDAAGHPLMAGFGHAVARDWARLAQLLAQDGVWEGRRLLDRDFMDNLRAPAPAWLAGGSPIYAGQVWRTAERMQAPEMPSDGFAMLGAEGQAAWIFPSQDLVVVRLNFGRGEVPGRPSESARVEREMLDEILASLPNPPEAPEEVRALDALKAWFAALEAGDLAAMRTHSTDDLTLYDAGRILDEAELHALVVDARAQVQDYRWILSNAVVDVEGDLAVIRYRNEGWRRSTDGRVAQPQWMESAHLVKRDGRWKLRFLQSSRMS
jgi:CubicO group peptidase (beta-lactamase class C family)